MNNAIFQGFVRERKKYKLAPCKSMHAGCCETFGKSNMISFLEKKLKRHVQMPKNRCCMGLEIHKNCFSTPLGILLSPILPATKPV